MDAIQSRANGSKSAPPMELWVSIAAEATVVLEAVLLARIGALNPPAKHCSIMTIKVSYFGSSASLLAKSAP